MITCHLKYVLDPTKATEFEQYCKLWLTLIKNFGGVHHGYLLPSEGASNIASQVRHHESEARHQTPNKFFPDSRLVELSSRFQEFFVVAR